MMPKPAVGATQPIIDSHHHFFGLRTVYYPWLTDRPEPNFLLGDYNAIKRNYLPADYRRESESCGIVKTVHVEAEADHNNPLAETRWLTSLAEQEGLPSAIVAHASFAASDIEETLAAQAAFPLVRGIRCKPTTSVSPKSCVSGQPAAMDDPAWRHGLKLLSRFSLSWDLRVPFWHLTEAAALVEREIPDTTVIIEHAGLPWDRSADGLAIWRAALTQLAQLDNVTIKVSELGLKTAPWSYEDNRRIVLEVLEIFGPARCMFGSNAPVSSLKISFADQLEAIQRMVAGLTDEERHLFFYENAARIYRL